MSALATPPIAARVSERAVSTKTGKEKPESGFSTLLEQAVQEGEKEAPSPVKKETRNSAGQDEFRRSDLNRAAGIPGDKGEVLALAVVPQLPSLPVPAATSEAPSPAAKTALPEGVSIDTSGAPPMGELAFGVQIKPTTQPEPPPPEPPADQTESELLASPGKESGHIRLEAEPELKTSEEPKKDQVTEHLQQPHSLDSFPVRTESSQVRSSQAETRMAEPAPTSRLEVPVKDPLPNSQPVRQITLKLEHPGQEAVNLRLMERGGEVRVAVYAADRDVTHALRAGLSELTERLETNGYRADTWIPEAAQVSLSTDTPRQQGSTDWSQGERQQQQQHSGGQGGQQQHNPRHNRRWIEEWNEMPR